VIYAPKVTTGLSPGFQPGFNPGNPQNNEFALKGREADLTKLAPIAALNLECAIETCYNWTYFRVVSTFDLPPLQGESLWVAVPRVETLG
jgi:hypothetical protein